MHKILVVDDNVEYAERIIDILNETDVPFNFYQALNGKIASSIAERKLPDLIITDWDMPEMDGILLIKHLKSLESTKDIPIIMCTGVMTETENLKTALDAGAIDFIRKPVEKLELIARVHSMLKLSDSMKRIKEQNILLLQHEQEIIKQNEQLTELNVTKDKFFSIISHDLRGPFHGFLGLTQVMDEDLTSLSLTEIKEMASVMHKSATNLFGFLQNLLEWSRMQQGVASFNPEPIVLRPYINAVLQPIVDLANKKRLSFSLDIPETLKVFADANMLASTIRNLCSNSVKFTSSGGSISIFAKASVNSTVELLVKDNGIGMNREMVGDMFKLDKNINRKGTDDEPSTGLGLLLCKEFVEKNNGKIWVESEVGIGTTFYISLPSVAESIQSK